MSFEAEGEDCSGEGTDAVDIAEAEANCRTLFLLCASPELHLKLDWSEGLQEGVSGYNHTILCKCRLNCFRGPDPEVCRYAFLVMSKHDDACCPTTLKWASLLRSNWLSFQRNPSTRSAPLTEPKTNAKSNLVVPIQDSWGWAL